MIDMALEGRICCLASPDLYVSWKTENALVNHVFIRVRSCCHNKIITQICPVIVLEVLLCRRSVTLITRLTASGLHWGNIWHSTVRPGKWGVEGRIRLIHFFHCLIKKYNKNRAVYCSAVWRAREQLLFALYRGNYWGPGRAGLGSGLPPTRGTAEVSRSRNLGQTVDTIKDNCIH